jgi:hypothetical protein
MDKTSSPPLSLPAHPGSQLRSLLPILLVVYVPLGIVLVALTLQQRIPLPVLLEDVTYLAEVPFYTGFISNLGILIWMSAAAVAGFTYLVLRSHPNHRARPFLLASFLLTLFLTLDDLYLIHDEFFPEYLGISETAFFVGYIVIVAAYVYAFRRTLMRSEYLLLILAFGFFAFSLAIDNVQELLPGLYSSIREGTGNPIVIDAEGAQQAVEGTVSSIRYMAEDGSKFLGIVTWCLFFVRYCHAQLKAQLR